MARRAPGKNPGGRPTKYDPDAWAAVTPALLAAAKKGASIAKLCVVAKVRRTTLYDWMAQHKDVSDTIDECMELAQTHLEQIGLENIEGKRTGDMATLRFFLMNRFRKDYASERTESTVKSETKLDLQGAENVLAGVSAEDLRALLAAKEAETDDGK